MYIILDPSCRQAFLAALCSQTDRPLKLRRHADGLELGHISPALAAAALARGAFPVYERRLLAALAANALVGSSLPEDGLIAASLGLISSDVGARSLFRGPGRLERLEKRLTELLQKERTLHFDGFCRFRLPGYVSYLRLTLDLAADALLMQEEAREFHCLLARTSAVRGSGPQLTLSFCPGGLFELEEDGQVEGGLFRGQEDALVADILLRRPSRLQMKGCVWAPLTLTSLLEEVLGARLTCLD